MQLFIKSLKITRSILNQFSGRVPSWLKFVKYKNIILNKVKRTHIFKFYARLTGAINHSSSSNIQIYDTFE